MATYGTIGDVDHLDLGELWTGLCQVHIVSIIPSWIYSIVDVDICISFIM